MQPATPISPRGPETGYRPSVPRLISSGGGFWTLAWEGDILRLRARPVPPLTILLIVLAVSAILVAPGGAIMRSSQSLPLAVIAAPLGLGLGGVWWGAVGGNIIESRRSDAIRFDRLSRVVTFPRSGRSVALTNVIRIELAWTTIRFSAARTGGLRHIVVCCRTEGGHTGYEPALTRGGPMAHLGERLAAELGVTFARTDCGLWDAETRQWASDRSGGRHLSRSDQRGV